MTPAVSHNKNPSPTPPPVTDRSKRQQGAKIGEVVYPKRSPSHAAIGALQLVPTMEADTHVGSNVKKGFPSGTNACNGFNRNGFVREVRNVNQGGLPRRGVEDVLLAGVEIDAFLLVPSEHVVDPAHHQRPGRRDVLRA